MKRGKKCSLALVLITSIFLSCATNQNENNNSNTQNSNQKLVVRGSEQNPAKLEKDQFLSVTDQSTNPVYLTATNWSKVRITSDFLDAIQAHKDFSNEKKFELLSYIFDELPINSNDGTVRDIYVGKYFNTNEPLIIRVGVLTPVEELKTKNDKVIVLMSNIFKLPDGSLNKKAGGFINLDSNAAIFCGLKNTLLTNGQKTENKDIKITEKSTGIETVIIAQAYLHDENLANDIEAAKAVTQIIAENKDMPAIIIMAMLMKYEYYLSIEDISSADKLWSEILAYSKNVPGDMNPESLEVMNGESIYLMKKLLETKKT